MEKLEAVEIVQWDVPYREVERRAVSWQDVGLQRPRLLLGDSCGHAESSSLLFQKLPIHSLQLTEVLWKLNEIIHFYILITTFYILTFKKIWTNVKVLLNH